LKNITPFRGLKFNNLTNSFIDQIDKIVIRNPERVIIST